VTIEASIGSTTATWAEEACKKCQIEVHKTSESCLPM
jgi:hypothetical protein